jgi:hypothetical protein
VHQTKHFSIEILRPKVWVGARVNAAATRAAPCRQRRPWLVLATAWTPARQPAGMQPGLSLTWTVVVSEYRAGKRVGDLLDRADCALQQAMNAGRNRMMAEDAAEP